MSLLSEIQQKLKAPKDQKNTFGNYKYRSCEDIVEAVKPLLGDSHLVMTDDIVCIADRIYVKATATLTCGKETYSASAFAREPLVKKGMDDSQITGATSSYARKYALNGLFCIDDTKDADTDEVKNMANNADPIVEPVKTVKPAPEQKLAAANKAVDNLINELVDCKFESDINLILEAHKKEIERLASYPEVKKRWENALVEKYREVKNA